MEQACKNKLTGFLLAMLGCASVYCQSDSASVNTYEGLSLKELLNVKIVSVSKKAELLFDAPLSSSVITREEIRRAGSTTIMEALRLAPGMIVREQTNGNYDIYIRGMDNVPPNAPFEGSSTTVLVMIDNRPIYNYLKGGAFWETLPIDLNDVEKIEVIRGPAAALYGPNAVSGVINIITREIKKKGLNAVANTQHGSASTFITNASLGYRFNKKWTVGLSGNYQGRDRTQTSYYEIFRNQYVDNPDYLIGFATDTVTDVKGLFPYPQLAMRKYAGNGLISYHPSENVKFDVAAGAQHSIVQKVSTENGITPLATVSSDSRYANISARIKGFSTQFAYHTGTQLVDHRPGNKYDFITLDANIEYNYVRGKFSVKPGLSYRSAVYDDTKYSDTINKTGLFNARGRIATQSASLRGEYTALHKRLRLVAGFIASNFNFPDTSYISYELAATYKLHAKHLIRAAYSTAPRSSSIFDTYVNQRFGMFPVSDRKFMLFQVESNKSLKLLTASMFEIGYRGYLAPAVHIDLELFDTHSKNYSSVVTNSAYTLMSGQDTVVVAPFKATNLPMDLQQLGVTASLTYTTKKIQAKPFLTWQKSIIRNYSVYMNTPDAALNPTMPYDPALHNIYSGMGSRTTAKGTPAVYGGAYINYILSPAWNINASAYYYSAQTYYHVSNVVLNDGIRGIDHIPAKLIINANLSYEPVKGLRIFCAAKNLLNDHSREYFRSDDMPFMLLGGLSYEF